MNALDLFVFVLNYVRNFEALHLDVTKVCKTSCWLIILLVNTKENKLYFGC